MCSLAFKLIFVSQVIKNFARFNFGVAFMLEHLFLLFDWLVFEFKIYLNSLDLS